MTTPSSPHAVITEPAQQRRLILSLSIIIFFSVLNGTMFNVSIPDIARQFGLRPSAVSWVVSGYIIVFALGSVTYGRLADSWPVKDLITIGLILFSTGSLIGFFAQWYPLLVVGRVVQASGSGAIPALAMLVATRSLPANIRGRSLGIIASIVAVGGAVGPLLGGFITTTLHWRYLFLFSLATLGAIPVLRRVLPEEQGGRTAFDLTGALLLAGSVSGMLLFVTVPRWWLLATGTALGSWFLVHVRRSPNPFVALPLFQVRRYRNTLVTAFFTIGTIFGMMFMTPLMLRALNGLSAANIGLVMLPGSATAALLGFVGGRLSDRKGSIWVVRTGQLLLAAGFLLLACAAGRTGAVIALCLTLCYAGFSFLQSSLAHTVSSIVPKEQMGIGMGMYNLATFLSGAVNAAVLGKVLDHAQGHAAVIPRVIPPGAEAYSNIFLGLAVIALTARSFFSRTFLVEP